jgi:hypothetical protein
MMIYVFFAGAIFFGYLCGRVHQAKLDGDRGFAARLERQRRTLTPFCDRAHIKFPDHTYLRQRLHVVRNGRTK